jgi:hypothetical protein
MRPGDSLYSNLAIDLGTAYYVTSLGVNLLLTTLIILRLLLYRRTVSRTLPAEYTKHYLSVATIVIESVLLYSVFALAFIITYILNNPMNQVFMYMSSACQVHRPPIICAWCNYAIAFAANRGLYDYIKSCARTRVVIKYASFRDNIYQYTFQSAGVHHPRRR